MAINPLLVSIKQASDLPSAIPTSAGEFLFFEDDTLQKSPMSDIYDKVTSGIKGVATQTNAPTVYDPVLYPNGLTEIWRVFDPLTSPNSWGNIAVTQAELNANDIYFVVTNGVVVKKTSPKVQGRSVTSITKTATAGEVDTYTVTYSDATTSTFTVTNGTNAKLPLYSAIKSANIAAGTQFIDDQNGNIIYRVKTGQTLLTTELPAYSVKVERVGGKQIDNPDIFQIVDINENVTARQSADGELYLPSLDNSVQNEVKNKYNKSQRSNIIEVVDRNDNVTMSQDENGELYLPSLDNSVQNEIKAIAKKANAGISIESHEKLAGDAETQTAIINMIANGDHAPIPLGFAHRNYTLPNILGQLTVTTPFVLKKLTTPYREDDRVVHPYVMEVPAKIRGYRYFMCINPYQDDNQENPVIYGSNDGDNFEMLDGFEQPIAFPKDHISPSFISDSLFAYDYDSGDIICVYRYTQQVDGINKSTYLGRRTKDFFHWSEPEVVFPERSWGVGEMVSGSLLFNPRNNTWYFFTIDNISDIFVRTATKKWEWSEPIPIIKGFANAWHGEVKICGDKLVMLVMGHNASNLYLGTSADWVTWQFNSTPIVQPDLNYGFYKASFLPKISDGKLHLKIYTTSNAVADAATTKRLYIGETNEINL